MTQHTDKVPLLSVQSTDDKRFTVLRELLNSVFDDVEDNAWSVSVNLGKFVDALSTMEQKDIDTISRTVKKYQVKGTSSGISGERTYGYDRSRVDRKMIRRRRAN
jgi:hypothetical protein|tara:strand:- start:98 stop:412 length:315 start_codon:yes stop_codon:yes gene_type:complete